MERAKTALISLLSLLLAATCAWASAPPLNVSSRFITQDTTWQGKVVVEGVVKVGPGVTLTILPGSKILFSRSINPKTQLGESALFLQGRLIARGTPEQPITFSSAADDPQAGDWDGINLIASEDQLSILEHCRILYADKGVHAHFATLRIRDCLFAHNNRAIYCQEMRLDLTDNEIKNNRSAMRCRDATLSMSGNLIHHNYWGMDLYNSRAAISDNSFRVHLMYGLRLRRVESWLQDN